MQPKERPVFKAKKGRQVAQEDIAGFIKEMNQKTIPEIVDVMEKRRLLAVQKREEQLKC